MKVFVQGSTGVLGRRVVAAFAGAGHDVLGLARNDAGQARVRAAGGTPARGDLFSRAAMAKAAEGCDVFVQAATKVPAGPRLGAKDFAENDRVRTEGAKALVEAAVDVGADHYLRESIVWVARPADGSPFDESTPPSPDPLLAATVRSEQITAGACGRAGIGHTTLRFGWFYSHDSSWTRNFGEQLARHKLPLIGKGDAPLSFVHPDDAASAFLAAVERKAVGTFHVVGDSTATAAEFFGGLASRLEARAPRHVPPWVARIAAGRSTVLFITTPMVTTNRAFQDATGWRPKFPTVETGLDQVVASWRQEGFLVR